MHLSEELVTCSNRPDPKIVAIFFAAQRICLALAGIICITELCGWVMPAVGSKLPTGWALMKANTASCFLLCVASLMLTHPRRGKKSQLAGSLCGLLIIIVAGSAMIAHITGQSGFIETLLAADSTADMPGRMSLQTSLFFLLISPLLIFSRSRRFSLDLFAIPVMVLIVVITSGYTAGALKMFGQSWQTRTSPQTLICMYLVFTATLIKRTDSGIFGLFAGVGIGSHIARISLPILIGLTLFIIGVGSELEKSGIIQHTYAIGLTAIGLSILLLANVTIMAKKINQLEGDLRNSSLKDELTKLYNRRGFYLLGDYAFSEARRSRAPLTVVYFDLDGLKKINDTLGHDVGSELLADFGFLLDSEFRQSDVVARLGGDEFAVLARNTDMTPAIERLAHSTALANNTTDKPYQISYSFGVVTRDPDGKESFDDLINQADELMYENKTRKKANLE